jgi:hypothetical protein
MSGMDVSVLILLIVTALVTSAALAWRAVMRDKRASTRPASRDAGGGGPESYDSGGAAAPVKSRDHDRADESAADGGSDGGDGGGGGD